MMCERMSAAAQFETLQGRFVEEVTRIERELSQSKASEVRVPLSLRCHLLLCVCVLCVAVRGVAAAARHQLVSVVCPSVWLPLVPSPQAAARKAAEDTEARLLKLLEKQTEYTTTIAALEAERDKLAQDLAAMGVEIDE